MNIKLYDSEYSEIVSKYRDRQTASSIARFYSVSLTTILRILREMGVVIEQRRNPWNKGKKLPSSYAWNKGLTKSTHPSIARGREKYKERYRNGEFKHGIIAPDIEILRRAKIRQSILKRYDNGWLPKAGRCQKIKYQSKIAGEVLLDGQWELAFAKFLDSCGYSWKRNKIRFSYLNEECKQSFYTPDFFIKDYNCYVEVKGYETIKDRCKWRDFPFNLIIIRKKHIEAIKMGLFQFGKMLESSNSPDC